MEIEGNIMKRNSITIFLESPSGNIDFPVITSLPWSNNEPDFSGIEEPTLSILQAAWEAGKDNIEIIPDSKPIPEIKNPDWGNFGGAIITSELYEKYKSNPDFQMLGIMNTVFASNGGNAQMYPAFVLIWNRFCQSSGGLLIKEIRVIAELLLMCNLPFVINNKGEIAHL